MTNRYLVRRGVRIREVAVPKVNEMDSSLRGATALVCNQNARRPEPPITLIVTLAYGTHFSYGITQLTDFGNDSIDDSRSERIAVVEKGCHRWKEVVRC